MSSMFILGTGISFKVLLLIAIISIILFVIVFIIKSPKNNESETKFHKGLVGLFGVLAIIVLSASFTIDNTEWQNEINKKKAIDEAYNKMSEDEDSSYNEYRNEQFDTVIDR